MGLPWPPIYTRLSAGHYTTALISSCCQQPYVAKTDQGGRNIDLHYIFWHFYVILRHLYSLKLIFWDGHLYYCNTKLHWHCEVNMLSMAATYWVKRKFVCKTILYSECGLVKGFFVGMIWPAFLQCNCDNFDNCSAFQRKQTNRPNKVDWQMK